MCKISCSPYLRHIPSSYTTHLVNSLSFMGFWELSRGHALVLFIFFAGCLLKLASSLIRNAAAAFAGAQANFYSSHTSVYAEIEALWNGLNLCVQLNLQRVEVETDSQLLVLWLTGKAKWPWLSYSKVACYLLNACLYGLWKSIYLPWSQHCSELIGLDGFFSRIFAIFHCVNSSNFC